MTLFKRLSAALFAGAFIASGSVALADDHADAAKILITNVDIFDGKSERLIKGRDVLIAGNLISKIGRNLDAGEGAAVIDGRGGTLMPGMIEAHAHVALNGPDIKVMTADMTWDELAIGAVGVLDMYLKEGFTTVRDMGGAGGGLRRARDAGQFVGPRFYPAGAFIGTVGGHGDFAFYSSLPGDPSNFMRLNMMSIVAGESEMLTAARMNFRMGATHIKLMLTGGVASLYDPWQLMGMTQSEIEAATEVARAYGSYAGAHMYQKAAIMRALNAGVMTCEHCFMFDGEVAKKMEEMGAYMTTNLTAFSPLLAKTSMLADERNQRKFASFSESTGTYFDMVKKYKPKRGFITDCAGTAPVCQQQVSYEKFLAGDFFSPYEALVSLTSVNGEIMALSGDYINPYPEGKLGVIEEGAYADILVVDGNPLEDLSVIGANSVWFEAEYRPDGVETIKVIMKDGKFYKNTLN